MISKVLSNINHFMMQEISCNLAIIKEVKKILVLFSAVYV